MVKINIARNILLKFSILGLLIVYYAFSDNSMLKTVVQLSFIGCVALMFIVSPYIRKEWYYVWAMGWIILCFFSAMWAYNSVGAWNYSISVLQAMIFGILIVVVYEKTNVELEWIEKCFIIAGIVMVLVILRQTPLTSLGSERFGERANIHPNTVSNNLLFSEIIAFYCFMKKRNEKNNLRYLVLAMAFLGFNFFTASKKGLLIGIVIPILIWLMYDKELSKKVKNIILIVFVAMLSLVALSYYSDILTELTRRMTMFIELMSGNTSDDMSTAGRLILYKDAWKVFTEHPIIGVGIDNFRYVNTGVMAGFYAHCNYTELLADMGLIGFIFYYSIFGRIIHKLVILIKKGQRDYVAILGISLAVLLLDIAQVSYYSELTHILIAYLYIKSEHVVLE